MRAGMQSLLTLLRGEPLDGIAEPEWMAALDLAEQENLLPWTAARLTATPPWGPQLTERLQRVCRDARRSAFLWSSTLRSALLEFHSQAIPVIALKGPSLAERLYGDAALRSYSDLDLLVRKSDLSRAEDLLTVLGFAPAGCRVDNEQPWRRGDITVDLHHDVEDPLIFDFRIDEVWQRAQPAEFHGAPVHLLAPADELLFLCLHGVRHRFGNLRLILDLVFAFRCWPSFATRPLRNSTAAAVLALGIRMAAYLDPRLSVPDPVSLSEGDRKALDALADQLWRELPCRPAALFGWLAKHRIFLALETRTWRRNRARLCHLRNLLARLLDVDFAFAARFHLHRRWQVWLLRPIRLLLKAARGTVSG